MLNVSENYLSVRDKIELCFLPILVGVAMLLGGTSQAVFTYKLPLYLTSIIGLSLAVSVFKGRRHNSGDTALILAGCSFVIGSLIFLLPIPFELWTSLPGRSEIANSLNELPYRPNWLPLTLTYSSSLYAALALLPGLAIFALGQRASQTTLNNTMLVFLVVSTFSAVLGLIQLIFPEQGLYLYEIRNQNRPIGLFSNVNHQACLLSMAFGPLLYLVFKSKNYSSKQSAKLKNIRLFAFLALVTCGLTILLARSITGYALSALVLCVFAAQFSYGKGLIALATIIFLAVMDFTFFDRGVAGVLLELEGSESNSRPVIYRKTIEMIQDFFPIGSGPASFQDLYLRYENREIMDNLFMPEAHSDWLQILLEYGVFGIFTVFLLVCGIINQGIRHFKENKNSFIILIGVSAVLPLLHSAVDYPLRNPSISAVMIFLIIFTIRGNPPQFARE